MPYRCVVPNCRGNYDKKSKVTLFGFPKDVRRRDIWTHSIHRKDLVPTKFSKVCINFCFNNFYV